MKSKINYSLFILMILVVSLMFGMVAQAEQQEAVFLPALSMNAKDKASQEDQVTIPAWGGVFRAIPLDNNMLLVLTISPYNPTNIVAYLYDEYGAQSPLEGWLVSGIPDRVFVSGCVWVLSETIDNQIDVHNIQLPVDVFCLE